VRPRKVTAQIPDTSSNGDNAPVGNGDQGATTPANAGNAAQGQGADTKPSSNGDNAPAGNGDQGTTTSANAVNAEQGQGADTI
ncbi:hypothetical protein, partial [Vibrio hepatarius]